jgi:hypothetical protein
MDVVTAILIDLYNKTLLVYRIVAQVSKLFDKLLYRNFDSLPTKPTLKQSLTLQTQEIPS